MTIENTTGSTVASPDAKALSAKSRNLPSSFDPLTFVPGPGQLVMLPLGGTEQIGMNCMIYGARDDRGRAKFIIVDCGLAFADEEETPGIQSFMPDPWFLEERADDILALVVTHAHEDHIGAVHRLWPRLTCPIYASPFCAHVLRGRFAEAKTRHMVQIRKFEIGAAFDIGPFSIEPVQLTHSVPEMCGLAIRTAAGTVFHTGDWKLDPTPLVGPASDLAALKRLGDEGVLAMVCDSTNASVPHAAGSEADARDGLMGAFANRSGMIVVACFSSNIARIRAIAEAAHAQGRQVGLSGRSLRRMEQAARACGYLKDVPPFLDEFELSALPPREAVLICTGSQAEERSALVRIVHGQHPRLKLRSGDLAIFSARAIPGNEEQIADLVRRLKDRDVDVIMPAQQRVHVSGHPGQEDLRRAYDLLRPQVLVPVHGTPAHLEAHGAFAKSCGIRQILLPRDGMIASLSSAGVSVLGQIRTSLFAYDGSRVFPWKGPRPRMSSSEEGSIAAAMPAALKGDEIAA